MINLSQLISRYKTRPVLFMVVGVLIALNLGKFLLGYYEARQAQIASRMELLEQNRNAVMQLEDLRARVDQLSERRKEMEVYMFTGKSEEEVASAMQIDLQEKIAKAGLAPESLRPTPTSKSDKAKKEEFYELAIKLSLSGEINNFISFIAELYQAQKLYKIESFVIKPFQKKELKILIDLKGYYSLTDSPAAA